MNDLISIIIPAKNAEKYIKETLDGIVKQKLNTEIILIDDGSSDKTSEIAKSFDVKIIKNEVSLGPVKAKNQALKIAGGDYILFHDADDFMTEKALERLYNEFEPEIMAVEAKVKDFISPDCEDKNIKIKQDAYWGLFTGAILIKKEVFDKIGLFNESVTAGEIIDWQTKMEKANLKIKKIDFVSTNRRIHSSNFGRTQQKTEFKDYAALLRAKILNKVSKEDLQRSLCESFRGSDFTGVRKKLTDIEHNKNLKDFLKGFEGDCLKRAQNLCDKLEKVYAKNLVPLNQIYTEDELKELEKVKEFEQQSVKKNNYYEWKNFKLPIDVFDASVFYYKHGIESLDIFDNLENKAIIDVGSYIADSAIVFRNRFKNNPIYSFEPTLDNYKTGLKTIELNNVKNIVLENMGLGDCDCELKMEVCAEVVEGRKNIISDSGNVTVKMTTLDEYVKEKNIKVGLIKVDIEGFEQNFLKGAYNTIKAQKPILLLSIYHNYDDFYKIKPIIESWNLGYKFDIFQGVQNLSVIEVETLLVAFTI